MPSDSSWTTISRWTADLRAVFIDSFYEARVSKIYEQLFLRCESIELGNYEQEFA